MLKLAKSNTARYLEASTSEVYGDPAEHPQKETYFGNVNPDGIRSCYDESKRFAEAITMVYVRKYGLDARIIRIFNTYGPRMRKDDGRVVSTFINQALEEKPMTVFGEGTQTRSFCYVSDLVAGILAAMFGGNLKGEVFNLGNPEEYRVKDLAQKIKALIGSASPITFEALPEDDPARRQPDITKIKTLLQWEPKVSVDEGLKKTIEFYRK
jgi:nucleoside-diphosphate-sugar epimerase